MPIAISVQNFLHDYRISYDVVPHRHTRDSMHSASAAHVPGDQLAKGVLLEDENGYLMAVVPSTHKVDLGALSTQLNRRLGLATEGELSDLFKDCARGAIPPLGPAYGIEAIVDNSLANCNDIFFEAGDHTELVRVRGEDFMHLLIGSRYGYFSHHV